MDQFYYIIGQNPHFVVFFSNLRLILILSHENVSVKSGFSVNADMLVENLQEESLEEQRMGYDSVQTSAGLMGCKH